MAVPRALFVRRRWKYNPGEHVIFTGPTTDGKTTLAYQLQAHTISDRLPALGLVMKPRDRVPAAWTRHLGLQEVATWPPPSRLPWKPKPRGWTHWPRHTFNAKRDNEHMSEEFHKSLTWAYGRGNMVVFADEIYGLLGELKLQDEVIAIMSRGAGMGCGLWAASQRAAGSPGHGIPGHLWDNAHHLFFGPSTNLQMRRRQGELSMGLDPALVTEICRPGGGLQKFEFLYCRKQDSHGGPYYCIVGA